jgi:lipopolysaccharide export system permease protein
VVDDPTDSLLHYPEATKLEHVNRIIERYVLREVGQTWLAVTGVLLAIVVSNQLSRVLGQAADNQYARQVVFELIALGAVMNLAVVVPLGLLIAVILALGRLYHDSEMAALMACGYGTGRLLMPLLGMALLVAAGLGWLSFVQVPRADLHAQELKAEAINHAQFGQLDAGRFRSFSGGDAVFYAESIDHDGVLHHVFVQREAQGKLELALAARATYRMAGSEEAHIVTLYDGRRYEGKPGTRNFRVIEFAEHGIPVLTPAVGKSIDDPDTKPMAQLWGSPARADKAQVQSRLSTPLLALMLTIIAVPLAKLRPRQGRYAKVGYAIIVYFVYSNLISAASIWVEKGTLPPVIGVWAVHAAAVALATYLLWRDSPPQFWLRRREQKAKAQS